MGRKTAIIYLVTVAIVALASGLLLDFIYKQSGVSVGAMTHEMFPVWFEPLCAVILLAILAYALLVKPVKKVDEKIMEEKRSVEIKVKGMTCTHCENAVKRAIVESPGVEDAVVNLSTGFATIIGNGFDLDLIKTKITQLGYSVE